MVIKRYVKWDRIDSEVLLDRRDKILYVQRIQEEEDAKTRHNFERRCIGEKKL
jgi:hypothetical protein